MHFFNINCFYRFKEASTTTNLFLYERLQHSKPPSLSKSTQKLHKSFKNLTFQVFCPFRSKFDAFFQHKLLLSLQRSLSDNESFPCLTFWHSKPPNFLKNRQKFSSIFVILGLKLRHFFIKKLHLFLWKSLLDNIFSLGIVFNIQSQEIYR